VESALGGVAICDGGDILKILLLKVPRAKNSTAPPQAMKISERPSETTTSDWTSTLGDTRNILLYIYRNKRAKKMKKTSLAAVGI